MKCRFLHPMRINYASAPDALKSLAVQRVAGSKTVWMISAGTVYESPRAAFWVRHGCAEAVDEQCEQLVSKTPEELAAARHAYERTAAGIHPEDFELYDKGYISGYNADLSYKPGPKWDEYQRQQEVLDAEGDW